MFRLDDREQAVLMAVTKLGLIKGDISAIAHEANLTLARTMEVRDYLIRQGYLVETQRRYRLTEEGTHLLLRELGREKKPQREMRSVELPDRGPGRN